jgi:hypothetical protein
VLARFRQVGLLSEEVRRKTVERMAVLAVHRPDDTWGGKLRTPCGTSGSCIALSPGDLEPGPSFLLSAGWGPLASPPSPTTAQRPNFS